MMKPNVENHLRAAIAGPSRLSILRSLLAVAVVAVALACPAAAHPHAWITARAAVVFNAAGEVTAVSMDWTFDKDYSGYAIEGLDTDGDGQFSPGELATLAEENIKALQEYDYFVYPRAGTEKVKWGAVSDYGIGRDDQELLQMQFVIPLQTPVDPRRAAFTFQVYDPSYYIDISYSEKDPLRTIGALPTGCNLALLASTADQETEATKDMLATKPKDWQPDPNEDFGAMFAQSVKVDCKAGS
jgi:ABC-type uncharacterized transport system substrate-binding protein